MGILTHSAEAADCLLRGTHRCSLLRIGDCACRGEAVEGHSWRPGEVCGRRFCRENSGVVNVAGKKIFDRLSPPCPIADRSGCTVRASGRAEVPAGCCACVRGLRGEPGCGFVAKKVSHFWGQPMVRPAPGIWVFKPADGREKRTLAQNSALQTC